MRLFGLLSLLIAITLGVWFSVQWLLGTGSEPAFQYEEEDPATINDLLDAAEGAARSIER